MQRHRLLATAVLLLAGCPRTEPPAARRRTAPPAAATPAAPPATPPAAAAEALARAREFPDGAPPGVDPAADADAAVAATEPADGDAGATADPSGDRTFDGTGIRVVIRRDHAVQVHTTDNWGAVFDTTFESCEFASHAVPTLRRTLSADKVDVVVRACGAPRPGAVLPRAGVAPARGGARPAARPAGAAR